MNQQLFNLFPTPVMYVEGVLDDMQLKNVYEYILNMKGQAQAHRSFAGTGVSSHWNLEGRNNIVERIANEVVGCENVLEVVFDIVNKFSEESGIRAGNIWESWFNIQQPGSFLNRHCHSGAFISGVIYINTDENSSPIRFDNPNPYIIHTQREKLTNFTYDYYDFKLKPGDMLLFPSWLHHSSGNIANMTDNRTIIAFNTTGTGWVWSTPD